MNSSLDTLEFPCLEVRQPIGTFYLGVMAAPDLVEISFADVRRLEQRDVERYLGIQRPLDAARVRELSQYVQTSDATFPTAVILAVKSEDVTYHLGRMQIARRRNVAQILDGQHRIAGLEAATADFESPVVIFVDMDLEEQALTFATINLKQTKVNRSLAYDLFDFAKARSPQKSAHQVAQLLNSETGSPLYRRIKLLGVATPGVKGETLTQALVVDKLLEMITRNALQDRDVLRRGGRLSTSSNDEVDVPFRRLFIEERDAVIARNVWNLLSAVRIRWSGAWEPVEPGFILNRTTGFSALMMFLRVAYPQLRGTEELVSESTFADVLARVPLESEDLNRDEFLPGSSGINKLFRVLVSAVKR
ncbi:MAG: DGQHR domain-containing protein [Tepidiformaceae bacterium]